MDNEKLNSDQKIINDFLASIKIEESLTVSPHIQQVLKQMQDTLNNPNHTTHFPPKNKKMNSTSFDKLSKKSKIKFIVEEQKMDSDNDVYSDPNIDTHQKISLIIHSITQSEQDIIEFPACRHLSLPNSNNNSKDYPYANSTIGSVCTNPLFLGAGLKHVVCGHYPRLTHCVGFTPDYDLLSLVSIEGVDHYLIRYRKILTSISYVFADSTGKIYNKINYPSSASLEKDNLDNLAFDLFSAHLSDISISSVSADSISNEIDQNTPPKVSYLSYVME